MKNYIFRWIGVLFLAVAATGCYDQDATVDLPTYNKRTAITCYLSPKDQNITVELGYTKPYFGPQDYEIPRVGDAKVTITDLSVGKSVQLPFDSSIMLYRIRAFALPIVNEHEYRVDVILKDGSVFFAKTTVPPALKETDLAIGQHRIGKLEANNWGGQSVNVGVELKSGTTRGGYFYAPKFDLVMEDGLGDFYGSTLYFSNEGIAEGKTADTLRYFFNDRIFMNMGPGGGTPTDPLTLRECTGTFWIMDVGYKERYLRDLQVSDNPFAEPVLLYSNWSNDAVGALGSYDWVETSLTP
ncbi:MAG: DUF4249 family protein [Sphingomonadales bacterium]|nr:DUF4249 family protein [Sphingomonadales bacterium]